MMKLIGIVTRGSKSEEGHSTNIMYSDIVKAIRKNGGIAVGIVLDEDYKELIDLVDGVIFSGGDDFEEYDKAALKYIYDIDKPVLGICLGMQLMGNIFGCKEVNVKNHKKNLSYAHSVHIFRNSKLYNIFKKDEIKVNSRHNSTIKDTIMKVSAISNDGVIEAIEDPNKKFFIGVQWHPENMIDYDLGQNNIFRIFLKAC